MPDLLVTFLCSSPAQAFQPCFTQPSFRSFWGLVCAWILCSGRRSLTRIIQVRATLPSSSTTAPFTASSARLAGTWMIWATVCSNCCCPSAPRS